MKVSIDTEGYLFIRSENETEGYALHKWHKDNSRGVGSLASIYPSGVTLCLKDRDKADFKKGGTDV